MVSNVYVIMITLILKFYTKLLTNRGYYNLNPIYNCENKINKYFISRKNRILLTVSTETLFLLKLMVSFRMKRSKVIT